jgi:hypothetical protein
MTLVAGRGPLSNDPAATAAAMLTTPTKDLQIDMDADSP